MKNNWSINNASAQSGRVAIVTGANTGLGFATAQALSGKGAKVILACRNEEKAQAAKQRILTKQPDAQLEVRQIDIGNLASVRNFANSIQQDYDQLDLLINNAGIMITPHFVTEDGFEGQLGVNYLGHFLLTGLLLPQLGATPHSRIVSLYSIAANWGGIQFEDLHFQKQYNAIKAYSQSKMACLMFALELNKRLAASAYNTVSLAAHPGYSQSELSRNLPLYLRAMLSLFGNFIMQSTEAGALPTLYAALGTDLHGGEAIGPSGKDEKKGPPTVVIPIAAARDEATRSQLWSLSEELVNFSYEI